MLQGITDAVAADPGVVVVSPAQPNDPDEPHRLPVVQVTPKTSPQDEATTELVHRLRDEVLVDGEAALGSEVAVTGQVPGHGRLLRTCSAADAVLLPGRAGACRSC